MRLFRPRHELIPEVYETRAYFRRLIKGARQELRYTLRSSHPPPPSKFVIFAQGRTGSTLLTSTLDRHPAIHCEDEILIVPRAFPQRFIELSARQKAAQAYGFHVKITQLHAWQGIHDVAAFLCEMQKNGWKIIYLWRENALRHVVSNVFAEASKAYHMDGSQERPNTIELPLNRLSKDIEFRMHLRDAEKSALRDLDFFAICYERDLMRPEDQLRTFASLQHVIGVTGTALQPKLKKMVIKPLSELLSNYDEVAEWVSQRPKYIEFLDG